MDDKRPRAERGSKQIKRVGIDPATRRQKFAARFTVNGKRTYVTLDATTIEDARIEYVDRLKKAREGKPYREPPPPPPAPPKVKPTVRELAERFTGSKDKFKSGAGSDTRDPLEYRRGVWSTLSCHVLPHLGDRPAEDVTRADVKAMREALLTAPGTHPRTVQKALVAASRLFGWALDDLELWEGANPCARIKKPATESSTDFYTSEEAARILATAGEKYPALLPLVATAYHTGMRKGEIAALRWGDVDLDGGRIVVTRSWKHAARKSGKPVTVWIHPYLGGILRAHHQAQAPESKEALVFPDAGGRMRDRWDLWGLDDLVVAAKVRRFKMPWHAFRHSYATELADQGAPLGVIQKALGQSTLQMAARYTEISAAQVKRYTEALPMGPTTPAPVDSLDAHRAAQAAAKRVGSG